MTGDFVSYVGDPALHDGEIVAVSRDGSDVRIQVRGVSGRSYELAFAGVERISQEGAVGMRVYALTEMCATPLLRRFVFANWEEDDAALEVEAVELSCTPLPG
jgi:hypothetical protein